MKSRLGEIANILIPYASIIEMSTVNMIPFLRATLQNSKKISVCTLYITQMDDNLYSICDARDDPFDGKYFPTGSIEHPFTSERELSKSWFLTGNVPKESCSCESAKNLSFPMIIDYLYQRFQYYRLICFRKENYETKVIDLDFKSDKIKKSITTEFVNKRCEGGTIKDLIDIVNIQGRSFNLEGLRQREFSCVVGKLRDLGLQASTSNNRISYITFERK